MRLQSRDTRASTLPRDTVGARLVHVRNAAADVRASHTHCPAYAATRLRLLQGSARRTSSAWVDGWMACPRRSPCAFRCWQFAQVIDPSAVNPHLRRTDGGLAQRSRMGGAAVTLVGTGAAGPHLSLDGVPTTVGQHLLLPAGTDAGQHSTNRAPELIKWVGPAVPSERRTVATARAASRNTAKSSLDSHQNRGTCPSLRDGILCPTVARPAPAAWQRSVLAMLSSANATRRIRNLRIKR